MNCDELCIKLGNGETNSQFNFSHQRKMNKMKNWGKSLLILVLGVVSPSIDGRSTLQNPNANLLQLPPKPAAIRPGDWERAEDSVILETPQVTNWGEWGKFEKCHPGLLVTGFQLKVETKTDNNDNTAVNGVRFSCGMPYHLDYIEMDTITSSYGRYGYAREKVFCEGYATGFQMKSQKPQGRNKDDVAAVNLKIICDDGIQLEGYDEKGDYYPDAEYSEPIECPEGMGVCGLQTQVEPTGWFRKKNYWFGKK